VRSAKWSLFLRFPHQHPAHISLLPHMHHLPHPPHPSWFAYSKYFLNSTNHDAPHYTVFFSLPLPSPSYTQHLLQQHAFNTTILKYPSCWKVMLHHSIFDSPNFQTAVWVSSSRVRIILDGTGQPSSHAQFTN
jgi:hypothetical protein